MEMILTVVHANTTTFLLFIHGFIHVIDKVHKVDLAGIRAPIQLNVQRVVMSQVIALCIPFSY